MQAKRPHQHTRGVAGCSRNPSPKTHTHSAQRSQEWRGASGAPIPAHTQPNTPARSGGVQPKPEPKHTHPRCAPKPGVAGCKRSAHTSTRQEWRGAAETRAQTHKPTARTQPGVAGCKRSAHTSTRQEWRGAAETGAHTHTPTARTQARSGGVEAERPHQHMPGVAGCSRNLSPNTHTYGAYPRQGWRGASRAPTPAHARSCGVQPKPEPKHTHPRRALQPGVAGCK